MTEGDTELGSKEKATKPRPNSKNLKIDFPEIRENKRPPFWVEVIIGYFVGMGSVLTVDNWPAIFQLSIFVWRLFLKSEAVGWAPAF